MCGVGIYCHPNGDRFEGMFFSNKPDGPGSFYERDIYTNNFTGQRRRQLIVLFCFVILLKLLRFVQSCPLKCASHLFLTS